jgi:hypothetical protein
LAAAALACAVVELGASLHLVLVRHERCAVHGELVHARGDHAAHAVAGASSGVSVSDAGPFAAADDEADHCAAAAERRSGAERPTVSSERFLPATLPEPRERLAGHARAILARAPKTSPPV